MRRYLLFVACIAASVMVACTKNGGSDPEPERVNFDAATFAQSLGSDYEAFISSYSASKVESSDEFFVMAGSFTAGNETIALNVNVSKDAYGNVGNISAVPENSDDDITLWNWYLGNYESEGLGAWLGARYNVYAADGTSEGGIYQTVAEALSLVASNDPSAIRICAIFGIIPGKAYAVPTFRDGRFSMQLVNNFLRLDYSALYGLIGTSYNDFAEEHWIIGSRMSFFGMNYFYCDYCLDMAGNSFNCDTNTDADQSVITGFSITISDAYTTDEQLDVWKQYASMDSSLKLGDFKSAYTSSFGSVGTTFATAQEALAYVEANGRPASGFDPDIVMQFGNETATLTVTLRSLSLVLSVEPASK